METTSRFSDIKGWGVDLDHKNRPAYPKERLPAREIGVHWSHPDQQSLKIKKFHSIERPGITPIFGTSVPPRGVSGRLRAFGFRFSENDLRHWLILLFADRVDMVEGLVEDLSRGRIPNIFAEMGLKSEFKYNRMGVLRKAALTTAVIGIGYYLLKSKK